MFPVKQPTGNAWQGIIVMRPHWIERYRQHFQNYFGKPFDRHLFQQEDGAPLRS